jgi:hypothetical protein
MPYPRAYHALIAQAPGVVGSGNANVHGALGSNNLFLFDGVNTTDPTMGTLATDFNYEAIQEVLVRTSTVGAEFGRATGAVVDVITRSGTNTFQGSFKYLMTNDQWNAQNTTASEVASADGTYASLARTRFDKVNPVYSYTLGGPVLRDRAWFFSGFETAKTTTAERQTNAAPGFANENYQQTTTSPFWSIRLTSQVQPHHNLWFKASESPTDGFVIDYWNGSAAERESLTAQNQSGRQVAAQYSGVLGERWTASVMVAHADSVINVVPFEIGTLDAGAPYVDLSDGRFYNGSTFDGRVNRPRTQMTAAAEYFTNVGTQAHAVKFGIDWQGIESENHFRFPANKLFYVTGFNPVTRTFTPNSYEEYDDAPSTSTGDQFAFYVRDRFQAGPRISIEAGLRLDWQTGNSDVGATTVDAFSVAPRLSGSYALTPDAKTIVIGSYGRFHDSILQDFSDQFASVPQQGNYNVYVWDGAEYVFDSRVEQGANTFKPNTDVSPRHMDEVTVGIERQLSNVLGVSMRYIGRNWSNFVDDVYSFNPDGTLSRVVANLDEADRTYRGLELAVVKRFSNQWTGSGSYTWSRTRGNHVGDAFTNLGDFLDADCLQSTDAGLGDASGVFPCREVQANLAGRPTFDRPHLVKFNGAYTRPVGPIDLTAGVVGSATSKTTYSKQRTVTVLRPGTMSSAGQTLTYFYEPRGSERVEGLLFLTDLSIEATYRAFSRSDVGFKFDVFNLFNNEEKINVNNSNWCNSTATSACATAVANFGTATARGSFNTPRTIRFTVLVRY